MNIDNIGVATASAEQSRRASSQLVERDDDHCGIAEKAGHPRLAWTTTPSLCDDTGRHADGDLVLDGSLEQCPDPSLAALQRQQRSGVERQSH